MATTVHIPPAVLQTVDVQARRRKISRNKYIVEALIARVEAERGETRWPQSFFAEMKQWRTDREHLTAVAELRRSVLGSRRSKKPISL